VTLERLLHEPQCRGLVSVLRHEALEDLAFVIDCTPQVTHLAIHLHVHLVEVPAPLPEPTHAAHPLPANVTCKQRTEPVPPVAHCLMADVDAALSEQVFDVPEAERVLHVQQHRQADDLR
jgi:hypothetical protein